MATNAPLSMPTAGKVVCGVLGIPAALLFALGLISFMTTPRILYRDLTLDWLSARCYFDGASIYTLHYESVRRYFGDDSDAWKVKINAHPPVSVLALLPLGLAPHKPATLIWNLLSLVILGAFVWVVLGPWGLNCDSWYRLSAYCLLTCSVPLTLQVKYAQINPLLTLLLAMAWVSDRHGKPLVAEGLVGVAAGLKLFPGFLLLYFLGTRQWKALAAAAGTIVGLHAAAVGVFGLGEVVHYFRDVVPQVNEWRSNWLNCSLGGFWSRLFDVTDGNTREWFHSPALARLLTIATSGAVAAAVDWRTWRARTGEQRDLAFAVTVVGMLLVSPITWDHYLLLFVPAAILWYYVATTTSWQLLFAAIVFPTGWLPLYLWWGLFFAPSQAPTPSGYVVAAPWQSVAILSPATYSLLALLILGLVWLGRLENASQSSVAEGREQTNG